MVLVLSRQDVAELVSMPALVEAVEKGLIEVSAGTAINPNRLRVFVPEHQAMMACMPAYLGQANALGAKIVSSSSRKPAPGEHPPDVGPYSARRHRRKIPVDHVRHPSRRAANSGGLGGGHSPSRDERCLQHGHHRLRRAGACGTRGRACSQEDRPGLRLRHRSSEGQAFPRKHDGTLRHRDPNRDQRRDRCRPSGHRCPCNHITEPGRGRRRLPAGRAYQRRRRTHAENP